jgi:2-keto-4-pentenoate hydratase
MTQLTDIQIKQLSDLLVGQWHAGGALSGLDEALCPEDRTQAYAVQACLDGDPANPVVGWKIAATSQKGQEHIGVDGPIAGRLLKLQQLEDGGTCSLARNNMDVAELEFAFSMGQTLPSRNTTYSMTEVLQAVAAVHPSIEVPSSRFGKFDQIGEVLLIADNACAHEYLLGPAFPDWADLDLPTHKVVANAGEKQRSGTGANALGDPRVALTWLVNELSAIGIPLEQNQFVMTGTCIDPIQVTAGDTLIADFGRLGSMSLNFTE